MGDGGTTGDVEFAFVEARRATLSTPEGETSFAGTFVGTGVGGARGAETPGPDLIDELALIEFALALPIDPVAAVGVADGAVFSSVDFFSSRGWSPVTASVGLLPGSGLPTLLLILFLAAVTRPVLLSFAMFVDKATRPLAACKAGTIDACALAPNATAVQTTVVIRANNLFILSVIY